jgi:uncharacterized protein YycO
MLPDDVCLKAGDIVLRCGSGITSRAVQYADGGGCYSHVGMVVDSSGVMMIVHAVPDEHDGSNDVDRVKMDAPDVFFSSMRTSNGRVMRYADSIAARRAAAEAYRIYRKKLLFDHDYNISDTTAMYCSELVEYAYQQAAGVSITCGARQDVSMPAIDFEQLILPSNFVESKLLTTIATF